MTILSDSHTVEIFNRLEEMGWHETVPAGAELATLTSGAKLFVDTSQERLITFGPQITRMSIRIEQLFDYAPNETIMYAEQCSPERAMAIFAVLGICDVSNEWMAWFLNLVYGDEDASPSAPAAYVDAEVDHGARDGFAE